MFEPEDDGDSKRVQRKRVGARAASGAQRAGNRGRDPAAHSASRHHLHQHQHGEHQRDTAQSVSAELADE
jgi:hypothetical protein